MEVVLEADPSGSGMVKADVVRAFSEIKHQIPHSCSEKTAKDGTIAELP